MGSARDTAFVEIPSGARFDSVPQNRRGHSSAGKRKYVADDRIDAIIREAYRRRLEDGDRKATYWAQTETRWPRFMIVRRGGELGLARTKEPDWSASELAILEETAHLGADAVRRKLAKQGFSRSRTAVLLKRKRLRLTAHLYGYSAKDLAGLFGIDSHRIHRWIAGGLLKAEPLGTGRLHDICWIRKEDVHTFVMNHADEYDLRKVEKWWFLSLITDGRISR